MVLLPLINLLYLKLLQVVLLELLQLEDIQVQALVQTLVVNLVMEILVVVDLVILIVAAVEQEEAVVALAALVPHLTLHLGKVGMDPLFHNSQVQFLHQ
jgi:hypothetical protein